ncbi:MAG: response regulator [Acidobacteriaceae bacterium]|nr:response regulator [Acidobacteriaceae bacterium]
MFTSDCPRQRPTVLIIDDSPEVQRYLRLVLETDDYSVETADTGEKGLERVRGGCRPAVVLLDMQMPGMDGLQTLRCLREIEPELKVVMCSSEDDPKIVQQATLLGAQAYLVKPVRHLYLSAVLEQCLTGELSGQTRRPAAVHATAWNGLDRAN